jgi:hypothetical protein
MAQKKEPSGRKKSARKKQGNLKDLSRPGQELSETQAKAVKGGLFGGGRKRVKIDFVD